MKKIWITWENHRRTTEIAAALEDVDLHVLQLDAVRPVRYVWLLLNTLLLLLRERPGVVIVQNPSIVLALFMVTLGKLIVKTVIVDAHNEGIAPFHPRYERLLPIYRLIQRCADLTIVTNDNLADVVRTNRGYPIVLPDKIPQLLTPRSIKLKGRHNVVFICTFEKDEPYRDVIDSARFIDPQTHLYITGRYQKAPSAIIHQAAPNVTFTGYLSEQDYADLLFSCDAVMDLTVMEDCLVCGAYEALSLEKPMILSNTRALKRFFHAGAVFTANDAGSIAQAINGLPGIQARLQAEVGRFKDVLSADWCEQMRHLHRFIDAAGRK